MEYHILHIEDSKTDADIIKRIIDKSGLNFSYQLATDENEVMNAFTLFTPNIVLCDHSLPAFDSKTAYMICKEKNPDLPFILVTGAVSEEFAVEMLKMGVDDYLLKSNLQRLPAAITNVLSKKEAEQKLTASVKELLDYKFALNQSSIVALTDQKGIITHVNDNFLKISKYSKVELIGQDLRIINSGHHISSFIQNLWVTIANGKTWKGELKNKAKDGSTYWVDTTIIPFLDNEGKPYQYMAIKADITERKKGEELLHKANTLFASIVNSSEDAIVSLTLEGIITSWNYGAEKIFGYKANEIIGKSILTFIPPSFHKEEREILKNIREGKTVDHFTTERLRKDGTVFQASIAISSIQNIEGEIVGASKILRDISETKRLEEDKKQLAKRFLLATQSANMAIWDWNLESNTIVGDDAMFKLYGVDPDDFDEVYNGWISRLHPEDREKVESDLQLAIENKKDYDCEFRVVWDDLSIHYVKATGIVERDSNGIARHMIGANLDITLQKQKEHQKNSLLTTLEKSLNEIYVFDSKTLKFSFVNHGALLNNGYSEQEIKELTPLDLKPEFTATTFNELVNPLVTNEKEKIIFFTNHKRKNGSLYPVEIHLQFVAEGNNKEFLAVILDITERKKAEEKIIESENRMRLATSSAGMGIWYWDNKNDKMVWDERQYQIYDINESQLESVYEGWLCRLHPEDKDRVNEVMQTAIADKKREYSSEFRIIWSDLSVHYIKGTGITEYDANGNVIGMIGVNWDVTAEKEREQHLKLLESVITNTNDSVLITEAEPLDELGPRILYVNDAFTKMTGYSSEEVIGKTPRILQGPKSDKAELKRLSEALRKWDSYETTLINYKKNGEEFWINFALTPVANEKGWYTHWVAIERDITEQYEHLKTIEAQNKKLRHIAWTQSHIIRAPLARMLGLLNIMEMDSFKSDDFPQLVTHFKTSLHELDDVIRGIVQKTQSLDL